LAGASSIHIAGGLALTVDIPHWKAYYPNAVRLIENVRVNEDYAADAAIAAAFADALAGFIAAPNGSILPDPSQAADGVVDGCGKSFYDVNGPPPAPACSTIDFCCNGQISFPSGSTICNDFSSCRNKGAPPAFSETQDPSNADSGASGGDVCSLGGIPDAARVPNCDCQIGVASYSKQYADTSSTTGGHWCCAFYSTGTACSNPNDDKATCFYVDKAPDGNACCAAVPKAPPPMCTSNVDPDIMAATNGAPECCPP
jgi:hypothetical protein